MLLEPADFARGLKIMKTAEVKMHKAFGGLGRARHSDITEQVKDYIRGFKVCTRSSIMIKFHRDLDSPTFRGIEETLAQAGFITVELVPGKNDKLYKWIGD